MKIEKFGTIVITEKGLIIEGFIIDAEGEDVGRHNAAAVLANIAQQRLESLSLSSDTHFMNCTFEGEATIQ